MLLLAVTYEQHQWGNPGRRRHARTAAAAGPQATEAGHYCICAARRWPGTGRQTQRAGAPGAIGLLPSGLACTPHSTADAPSTEQSSSSFLYGRWRNASCHHVLLLHAMGVGFRRDRDRRANPPLCYWAHHEQLGPLGVADPRACGCTAGHLLSLYTWNRMEPYHPWHFLMLAILLRSLWS